MTLQDLTEKTQVAFEQSQELEAKKEIVKELERVNGASALSIYASCSIFWMVYPTEIFDVLKYYKLFK